MSSSSAVTKKKQNKKMQAEAADAAAATTAENYINIFHKTILTQKVSLSIKQVGNNIKENLETKIINEIEGLCIREGYIKPKSVMVLQYSSGTINCDNIEFTVVFECLVCHPVEGMKILCNVKTITKAGIHTEVVLEDNIVPLIVFVARDHHNLNKAFNEVKEDDEIVVKILGIRFELNDTNICAIGELVEPK